MLILNILRIILFCTGAFAFSLLFNIKGKRLIFSTLAGLVCGVIFFISSHFSSRDVLSYFFASVAVTIYAEITARFLKTPVTSFLTSGIIPLVPGGKLYFTMVAALHGDLDTFFQQGMESIYIALSIAAGILFISPLKILITQLFSLTKNNITFLK